MRSYQMEEPGPAESTLAGSYLNAQDWLAFEVTEVLDDYSVERTFSFGDGEFQHYDYDAPLNSVFSVHKHAALGKLDFVIWNEFLANTLALTGNHETNLRSLSKQYTFLKQTLVEIAALAPSSGSHENFRCLSLLIKHCLLDRKLFNGFNLEDLYDQSIISADHWQDMQHFSTLNDLRVIDNAFQKHHCSQADVIDDSNENRDDMMFPCQTHDGHGVTAVEDREEEYSMSSCMKHPADYQILRMIRTLYNELPCINDYSYDEDTIDFGESYIWELQEFCLATQEGKDSLVRAFGLDSIFEVEREISSLILNSNSIDHSSLRGYGIIFQSQADFNSTSVRRLRRDEKEEFLTARLHSAFRQEDSRFRHEVGRIKRIRQEAGPENVIYTGTGSCDFAYQWYYKAWNTGIVAIRRFLRGILPRNLEQITRLLQVAYAMAMQDPKNPNFRATFDSDLDRWRTIVPSGDLSLFDAIAERYWDKTFDEVRSKTEYSADENLLYLQQLLSGIISDNPLAEISTESNQEGPQTSADKQRIEDVCNSILHVPKLLASIEDPKAYPHTRKPPICWKHAEPVIILIMSGAIFGGIFSFLLLLHEFASPSLSFQLSSLRSLCFANFEERNLHTLLLYLGLSSSSLWREANNGSTLPPRRNQRAESLRCRQCNKKFSSVGNRNRHVRSDCDRRAQFPCRNPGCKMVATRKAYRDRHEEIYCPRKQGIEYRMSWEVSLVGQELNHRDLKWGCGTEECVTVLM